MVSTNNAQELPPLPDDVIEHTRQLLNDSETHQWVLAYHLVDVVTELGDYYSGFLSKDQTEKSLRKARAHIISELSKKTGADKSTLRDRHNMGLFYPPEVRDKYDVLTWSQLRACKSAGDNWQEYADWAVNNLPAPCDLIRARIKNGGRMPPVWVSRWRRLLNIADQLEKDSDAPESIRYVTSIISDIELEFDKSDIV